MKRLMASALLIGGIAASVVVAIGIVIAIIWFVHKRQAKLQAEGEKSLEQIEAEVGLGGYAKAEKGVESAEEEAERKEAVIEKIEVSGEEKLKGDKGALKAVKAVEESAEAAKHEEIAEEATASIEARGMGITAILEKITKSVIEYTARKKNNILGEEQEAVIFKDILKKLKETEEHSGVDASISDYLRQFSGNLMAAFREDIGIERQKQELMENLVKELQNAVDAMKAAVKDAKTKLVRLEEEEGITRGNFRKELKDFEVSLKAKSKQIDELGKNKEVNPQLTVELMKEREVHWKQLDNAKAINNQLEETYKFMENAVKQMKKLLNNILANQKEMKKYDNTLASRKRQINRFKPLSDALSSIEKIQGTMKAHEAALQLSKNLKKYFKVYSEILEDDISFGYAIKGIVIKNIAISEQMVTFQQLADTLIKCEEAVANGVETLTSLLSGILEEASKKNVEAIIETLKQATKILNYEKNIEAFMKDLAASIKNKSSRLSEELDMIIEEDKKLLAQIKAENQSNSSHIGSVMATAVQRKIEMQPQYTKYADKFRQQLKQTNPTAANAYRQTIKA